ncbi:hypothetical protein [Acinetobacter pittii]|uniref:hypothetical protein n=2 Tax=Acinetobacter TaxID=469 RepID=UPI001F3BEBD0|nr:hypothetical protein [Acinetobacter pittii]
MLHKPFKLIRWFMSHFKFYSAPLSQIEAEDKYQIKQGKGRDYVEFDVLESRTEWVKNPRYHREELTIKGDVINPCNLVVNRRR